jgi:hypothetical protein
MAKCRNTAPEKQSGQVCNTSLGLLVIPLITIRLCIERQEKQEQQRAMKNAK